MLYFDSTYIAKLYVSEPDSGPVRALAYSADAITSAAHGRLELAYMFHRKLREGALDRLELRTHWAQVESDEREGLLCWFLPGEQTLRACAGAALTLPPNIFLRASDALHLACAREHGFRDIYSNDKHLLAAAKHFGLRGKNVIS